MIVLGVDDTTLATSIYEIFSNQAFPAVPEMVPRPGRRPSTGGFANKTFEMPNPNYFLP